MNVSKCKIFQHANYKNSLQKFLKLIYAKMYFCTLTSNQTPHYTLSYFVLFLIICYLLNKMNTS